MKKLRLFILGFILATPLVLAVSPVALAADTPSSQACLGTGGQPQPDGTCKDTNGGGIDFNGALKKVVNTLIFIVGAASVIMIIIGALRYVLSGGDSAGIKSAKDTILYAVVGVVVALIAYAIVTFVVNAISKPAPTPAPAQTNTATH